MKYAAGEYFDFLDFFDLGKDREIFRYDRLFHGHHEKTLKNNMRI